MVLPRLPRGTISLREFISREKGEADFSKEKAPYFASRDKRTYLFLVARREPLN